MKRQLKLLYTCMCGADVTDIAQNIMKYPSYTMRCTNCGMVVRIEHFDDWPIGTVLTERLA